MEARDTDGASPGLVQAEGDPLSRDGRADGERFRVLLVDDDALIQDTVGSMLHFLGYNPAVVSTGEEALTALEAGLQPVMVILDMDMPGLGGAATLPQIRIRRPGLPILIATGRVDATVMNLLRCHPQVGLMPKPFHLGDLRRHLSEWLLSCPATGG